MNAALDALRPARAELIASTPNKGGHRARAITLVKQAIDETSNGIRYAQQDFREMSSARDSLPASFCLRKTRADTI